MERFLGCVSGSDHGATGIHYVNGALLKEGQVFPVGTDPNIRFIIPLKSLDSATMPDLSDYKAIVGPKSPSLTMSAVSSRFLST